MGMFNSIFADLTCAKRNKTSIHTEIQIKWQDHDVRCLTNYVLGDILEEIEPEFNNTWIRTDFICNVCSIMKKSKSGENFISIDGQRRHFVYILINEGKIREILTHKEFKKRNVEKFVIY